MILAASCLSACFLAGCAGNADTRAMMPDRPVAATRTGKPVQVAVINGTKQHEILTNVQTEDFKHALELSLVRSGMFRTIGGDGYRVEAFMTSIKRSRVGEKLRVKMEVRYALRQRSLVIWRKSIWSSHDVLIDDNQADLGFRDATKGAARENIAILIRLLDKQRL